MSKQLQGLCIGINVVKTDGTIESINTFSSAVIDDDVKTAEEMAKQAQMLEENVLAIEE
ncbi:hypothetical protein FACS189459_3610 [Bacilli bacterium]|nr:hypothetical protein FACS189459_3610 [Bacilli bacterium]